MNNRVVFFSSFINETHVHFESSLIKVITNLYPQHEYILVGNTYHVGLVINQLGKNIQIKTEKIQANNRKCLMLKSFWKMVFIKNKFKVIHLTNYFPVSIGTFLFLFANMNIVFMHAYWRDTQNKFLRVFYFFALYIFFLFKFRTKIFILGEWIFNNIQKDRLFPKIFKKNYNWINHPYLLDQPFLYKISAYNNVFNFGFFAWKSSNYKNIENSDFLYIRDFILNKGGEITIKPDSFLSSEEYSSLFQSVDYLVFLSRDPAYQYRCSCVLIEAIFYQKPIICFRSGITSYLFGKYGNIGFMYDNLADMLDGIQKIIFSPNQVDYGIQRENLRLASMDFSELSNFKNQITQILD